jgi:hypothetical protein
MREITQTSSVNCFTAALASVLNVEIAELGIPWNGSNMTPIEHVPYLRKYGLSLVCTTPGCLEARWLDQYYIGVGVSPRDSGVMHAVVCHQGKIVWDPYYGRPAPVKEVLHVYFVTKIFTDKETPWTGELRVTESTPIAYSRPEPSGAIQEPTPRHSLRSEGQLRRPRREHQERLQSEV